MGGLFSKQADFCGGGIGFAGCAFFTGQADKAGFDRLVEKLQSFVRGVDQVAEGEVLGLAPILAVEADLDRAFFDHAVGHAAVLARQVSQSG